MTTHIVHYSGGVTSWGTAKRVASKYGTESLKLLFADTLIEDEDLYRFLIESAANVFGIVPDRGMLSYAMTLEPIESGNLDKRKKQLEELRWAAMAVMPGLIWIAEGRTPWEVFEDERYLGNTRIDPCSKILKRQFLDRYCRQHFIGPDVIHYLGFDWEEGHRAGPLREIFASEGRRVEFPLLDWKKESKLSLLNRELPAAGIHPPRLYADGFLHNNCGGFCVKVGQGSMAILLKTRPKRFDYHARQEHDFRVRIGKDVSVLRDRRGGELKTLTLEQFRRRVYQGNDYDETDVGACSCMAVEK